MEDATTIVDLIEQRVLTLGGVPCIRLSGAQAMEALHALDSFALVPNPDA